MTRLIEWTPAGQIFAAKFLADSLFRVRVTVRPLEQVNRCFGIYSVCNVHTERIPPAARPGD